MCLRRTEIKLPVRSTEIVQAELAPRSDGNATGSSQAGKPAQALRSAKQYQLILLTMALFVLAASFILQPPTNYAVMLPGFDVEIPGICVWRRATGADCPGCGLTRSFICLAHGDLNSAWQYNPAGLLLFLVCVAQIPYRGYQYYRLRHGRSEWQSRIGSIVIWIAVVALLAQWAARTAGLLV